MLQTAQAGPFGGSFKWKAGVFANEKIYGIPYAENAILIIDPILQTVDVSTITTGSTTAFPQYDDAVLGELSPQSYSYQKHLTLKLSSILPSLAPDGKIYGIPRSATTVLIIDPQAGTADASSLGGLPAGGNKWSGGLLGPNGLIYGVPGLQDPFLVIDCGMHCGGGIGPANQHLLSAYGNNF